MIDLNPSNFSCIEDFLSKFKTLGILLAECKIKKEYDQLMYMIFLLSLELRALFFVYISVHQIRTYFQGDIQKMLYFEAFCDFVLEYVNLLHNGLCIREYVLDTLKM